MGDLSKSVVEDVCYKFLDEKLNELTGNYEEKLRTQKEIFSEQIILLKKSLETLLVAKVSVVTNLRTRIQHLECNTEILKFIINEQKVLIDNNEQYGRRNMLRLNGFNIKKKRIF